MSYHEEHGSRGGARDDYYSGRRYDDSDDEDYREAERHAASHSEGSGDSSLFSTALGLLSGKKQSLKDEDLDEDDAVNQHRKFYGGSGSDSGHQATESNLGAAAAMQALKMFNSSSGEGKSSKSQFLGLAMAQASKLFDEQSAQGKTVSEPMTILQLWLLTEHIGLERQQARCRPAGRSDGPEDVSEVRQQQLRWKQAQRPDGSCQQVLVDLGVHIFSCTGNLTAGCTGIAGFNEIE